MPKSLGTRFMINGFEMQLGRPQNENPPNEWYFIEPWYQDKKFKGLLLNVVAEVYPEDITNGVIPSSISDSHLIYQLEYSPVLQNKAGILKNLFSELMHDVETEPLGEAKQSMVINWFSAENSYGSCGFSVTVSQHIRNWIIYADNSEAGAIEKVMMAAHRLLYPKWPVNKHDFRIWVREDARFGLSVPGNCACIGVSGMADTAHGLNYELHPHNNDSFAQQMELLAGIAYIWNAARKTKIDLP